MYDDACMYIIFVVLCGLGFDFDFWCLLYCYVFGGCTPFSGYPQSGYGQRTKADSPSKFRIIWLIWLIWPCLIWPMSVNAPNKGYMTKFAGTKRIMIYIRCVTHSLFIAHGPMLYQKSTQKSSHESPPKPRLTQHRHLSQSAIYQSWQFSSYSTLCISLLLLLGWSAGPSPPIFELISHSRTPPALRRVAEALAKCHRLKAMAGKCRRSSPVAAAVFQRETKTQVETKW